MSPKPDPCYCCGMPLRSNHWTVNVRGETTTVYVGSDCYRHIQAAGPAGYRHPVKGGARLIAPWYAATVALEAE